VIELRFGLMPLIRSCAVLWGTLYVLAAFRKLGN
jgi:hypothetical protein